MQDMQDKIMDRTGLRRVPLPKLYSSSKGLEDEVARLAEEELQRVHAEEELRRFTVLNNIKSKLEVEKEIEWMDNMIAAHKAHIEMLKLQNWIFENAWYFFSGIIIMYLILFYFNRKRNSQANDERVAIAARLLFETNSPKLKRRKNKIKKSKNQKNNPSHTSSEAAIVEDTDDCLICLDLLKDNLFYLEPCGHEFHRDCIKLWVNKEGTCPKCRAAAV